MLEMSAMKPNKNRNCCLPNREWGVNVMGVPGYLSHECRWPDLFFVWLLGVATGLLAL